MIPQVNHFKLTLLCLVGFSLINDNALSQNNDCIRNYIFKSESMPNSNGITKNVLLSWDLSRLSNYQNIKMEIEVQPLNSCWLQLEGKDRSGKKIIEIQPSLNIRGSVTLNSNELNCKCLKWRVKLNNDSDNCVQYTEWEFVSTNYEKNYTLIFASDIKLLHFVCTRKFCRDIGTILLRRFTIVIPQRNRTTQLNLRGMFRVNT